MMDDLPARQYIKLALSVGICIVPGFKGSLKYITESPTSNASLCVTQSCWCVHMWCYSASRNNWMCLVGMWSRFCQIRTKMWVGLILQLMTMSWVTSTLTSDSLGLDLRYTYSDDCAFTTWNSNSFPLIVGLCSPDLYRFECTNTYTVLQNSTHRRRVDWAVRHHAGRSVLAELGVPWSCSDKLRSVRHQIMCLEDKIKLFSFQAWSVSFTGLFDLRVFIQE